MFPSIKKSSRMTTTRDLINSLFDWRSSGMIIMSYIEIPIDENKRRYNEAVEQINTQRSKLEIFNTSENGDPYEKNWIANMKMLHHCFNLNPPKLTANDKELLNRCQTADKNRIDKFQSIDAVDSVIFRDVTILKLEFHERQKFIYMKSILDYSEFNFWCIQFSRLHTNEHVFNRIKGENICGSMHAYYKRCEYKYYDIQRVSSRRVRIGPKPDNDQKRCCTIM